MAEDKNLTPILVAINAEKAAIAYYARAAKRIVNPTGRAALEKIKKEEEKHLKSLKARFKKLSGRKLRAGEEEGAAAKISPLTEEHIPDREASDIEVCQVAIKDEIHAHGFYLDAAKNAPDAETRAILTELAAEETRHAATLRKICSILS